jgi:hypothetical protein
MRKIIKLTENDLLTIIKKVIDEQNIRDIDVKKLNRDKFENATRKYVDKTSVSFKGLDGKRHCSGAYC